MRAYVDQDTCIGCGLCTNTAPEVFELNEEGKAQAVADITAKNRESVMEAIAGCPVEAIQGEE